MGEAPAPLPERLVWQHEQRLAAVDREAMRVAARVEEVAKNAYAGRDTAGQALTLARANEELLAELRDDIKEWRHEVKADLEEWKKTVAATAASAVAGIAQRQKETDDAIRFWVRAVATPLIGLALLGLLYGVVKVTPVLRDAHLLGAAAPPAAAAGLPTSPDPTRR